MRTLGLVLAAVLAAAAAISDSSAQQATIPNYETARRSIFWAQLYASPRSGTHSDLYCGFEFKDRDDVEMQIEHVYPAAWFAGALGCGTRAQCQQRSTRFNFIEADLHNLYPAAAAANQERSNNLFGLLLNAEPIFDDCELKVDRGRRLAEPRRAARGNIARSVFYMSQAYDLPIHEPMLALLRAWNRADPVSRDERRRNGEIERRQGNRNPFIDDPTLADRTNFKTACATFDQRSRVAWGLCP